jgi:hypothetical protein
MSSNAAITSDTPRPIFQRRSADPEADLAPVAPLSQQLDTPDRLAHPGGLAPEHPNQLGQVILVVPKEFLRPTVVAENFAVFLDDFASDLDLGRVVPRRDSTGLLRSLRPTSAG